MQTKDLCLTARIGRPETLSRDCGPVNPGLNFGRITYLITGVPVDVPVFEVLRVCQRLLSCRANAYNAYQFTWPSLAMANRR